MKNTQNATWKVDLPGRYEQVNGIFWIPRERQLREDGAQQAEHDRVTDRRQQRPRRQYQHRYEAVQTGRTPTARSARRRAVR